MKNMKSEVLNLSGRETDGQFPAPTHWQPPELDTSELQHRFGNSVLLEFIRGHSFSAILRELVQNEYDAGGSVLEVAFGETSLEVAGNGTPIDRKGWRRLSVTLGTGSVPDLHGELKEKINGIGSKNFGLRSLFLFGDRIYVRSNGKQTLLDLQHGAPKQPRVDTTTTRMRGVRINVPYRTESTGALNAFTVEAESEVLDDFSREISLSLLKLAQHGTRKSLRRVIVSSTRKDRRIVWKQNIKKLKSTTRGTTLLARRITMTDSIVGQTQAEEEFEWQKRIKLPEEFCQEHIPEYFRDRGQHIRIGVSLRIKQGKLHPSIPAGIAYYPIGVAHAYTGNSVSISAPFEMDADRSQLVDPSNSPFNAWLLNLAANMTIELLRTDWFHRFGADVYRAVGTIERSVLPSYSEAVEASLKEDACWPSRSNSGRKKRMVQFASSRDLCLVPSPSLDDFLDDSRYFHSTLYSTVVLYDLAKRYGAKEFTLNSLIRLRCAGEDSDALQSNCKDGEACYYYTEFPDSWRDLAKQARCASALNEHSKQLTKEHRHDLAVSSTTLAASGSLRSPEELWFVPAEILDVCPVAEKDRLHPNLAPGKVLNKLCKTFNVADWIEDVIGRIVTDRADEREQKSLYRYIVSKSGRVPRKVLKLVRNSPVLRDQNGNWVSPRSITAPGTIGIRQFRPALYLPHQDYAKDKALAKALRFKNKITGDDVVRFAEVISAQPEMAPKLEKVLERRSRDLLTPRTINRLMSIKFILSNEGYLRSPSSLYLDSAKNRACIGPSGPYPVGNAKKLYAKLGCQSRPTEDQIMGHLATLRQNGQPPPRPDILYPELVAALKRESTPDIHADEEILWTGNVYSSPADTIIAGVWDKIFHDNVPLIKTSSTRLRWAYRELGVHDQPEQHHWEQFFVSVGERYSVEQSTLTGSQLNAIRTAYRYCKEIPSLPTDLPWLLDDVGHLHTTSDAESGRFVIEDDVPLGDELRNLSMAVSFADNTDPTIASFYRRQGVKLLTEIGSRIRDRIGELLPAPNWFRGDESVRRLADDDFGSALKTMAARDFPGNADVINRVQKTSERLADLERIAFASEITTYYQIGKSRVAVSTKYAWTENNIYLTRDLSRSRLKGMLAALIARDCLSDGRGDHARFSDSVFRLVTCETSGDMQEYLAQRGIRWHPKNNGHDGDFEEYISGVEEVVRAAIHPRLASSEAGRMSSSHGNEWTGSPVGQVLDSTAPLTLPPIEEVNAQIVHPNGNWSYSPGSPGGSWGGGGRWWPGNRNEERDRMIGRRGEEIVYMLEKERVRKAGYQEDCVVWVSEKNPASDFDIESVDDDGERLFIEVKSTTGADGKFHWSMPEFQRALQEQSQYILYRVYLANNSAPVVRSFRNPVALISCGGLYLDIASFRAEVQPYDSVQNM